MSLSNVLQVAIGLMLVYYALGLVVSILTTIIKDMLDLRAEALEKVLVEFIGTNETSQKIFADLREHRFIKQMIPIADKVLQMKNRGDGKRKAEKIPPDTFSLALLDVLATQQRAIDFVRSAVESLASVQPGGSEIKTLLEEVIGEGDDKKYVDALRSAVSRLPDNTVKEKERLNELIDLLMGKPEVQLQIIRANIEELPDGTPIKGALLGLTSLSKNDISAVRKELEARYNDALKNVALLYAQKVRVVVIGLALLVTIVSGADSIQIAQDLWMEPVRQQAMVEALAPLREQFGAQAVEWTKDENLTDEQKKEKVEQGVSDIALIANELQSVEGVSITWRGWPWNKANWEGGSRGVLFKVAGLILTWLAVSQGSSFWYDILKKINPRSTTSAPSTASAEPVSSEGATGATP